MRCSEFVKYSSLLLCFSSSETYAEIQTPPLLSEIRDFRVQGANVPGSNTVVSIDKSFEQLEIEKGVFHKKEFLDDLDRRYSTPVQQGLHDAQNSAPYFLSLVNSSIIDGAASDTPTMFLGLRCSDGTLSDFELSGWCSSGGSPYMLSINLNSATGSVTEKTVYLHDYKGFEKTVGVVCNPGSSYPAIVENFIQWNNNVVFCAVPFYMKISKWFHYSPVASTRFVNIGTGSVVASSNYMQYVTQILQSGPVNFVPTSVVNSQLMNLAAIKDLYSIPDVCAKVGIFPPQGVLAFKLKDETTPFFLDDFISRDWPAYRDKNGISCYSSLHAFGDDGTGNGSDLEETSLDLEMIMGVNPKAPTILWTEPETNDNAKDYINWLNSITSPNSPLKKNGINPMVWSISYGHCEADFDEKEARLIDAKFRDLVTFGISFFVASGDDGADCTSNSNNVGAEFPTSSPWVTSVGGTMRYAKSRGGIIWERGLSIECSANHTSGGGVSSYFAQPNYQSKKVQAYAGKGFTINQNNRAYPDIAALGNNVGIIAQNRAVSMTGTSASTPIIAGIFSLINEVLNSSNRNPISLANTLIYDISSAFYDVTHGNNQVTQRKDIGNVAVGGAVFPLSMFAVADPFYNATKGWDPVTGMGTPNYTELLKRVQSGKLYWDAEAYRDKETFMRERWTPFELFLAHITSQGDNSTLIPVVEDVFTDIYWHADASQTTYNLPEAESYCSQIGDGFRLPTLLELVTLVDYEKQSLPLINTTAFPDQNASTRFLSWNGPDGVASCVYFMPRPDAAGIQTVPLVTPYSDDLDCRLKGAHVRCLADEEPFPTFERDRFLDYNTGESITLATQTVLDRLTGFRWMFYPSMYYPSYPVNYCSPNDDGNWKIPTIKQMVSILTEKSDINGTLLPHLLKSSFWLSTLVPTVNNTNPLLSRVGDEEVEVRVWIDFGDDYIPQPSAVVCVEVPYE